MSLVDRIKTRTGWGVAAALTAGLLLRLFFVWRYALVSSDGLMYGDIAQNLLKHGVYGISTVTHGVAGVRPTLIRLPGYPLFLVVCFAVFGVGKYAAVMLVQVCVDLWTCLLVASVARRILGERAGMAALWMATVCPFTATYTATPLTEVLTLWTIALAFYGLVRWREAGTGLNRWVGLMGFALAYSVLLRPEQGLLAAALVPAMAWISWSERHRLEGSRSSGGSHVIWAWLKPVVVLAALTVLPLAPWTVRNWRTFHVIQPLAPRYANDPGERNPYGFQRWFRTWGIDFASTDEVYWNYEGDQISIANLPNRAFDSNEQYEVTDSLLNEYNATTTSTPKLDAGFAALAAVRVKADPVRYYLELPVARLLNMTLRPRADMLPWPLRWWRFREHTRATVGMGAFALLNLGYMVLAGLGLARRRMWSAWAPVVWAMVATMVLRALLLLTIDNSEPRYTLEFYPVLLVLGSGVVAGWVTASRWRRRLL